MLLYVHICVYIHSFPNEIFILYCNLESVSIDTIKRSVHTYVLNGPRFLYFYFDVELRDAEKIAINKFEYFETIIRIVRLGNSQLVRCVFNKGN